MGEAGIRQEPKGRRKKSGIICQRRGGEAGQGERVKAGLGHSQAKGRTSLTGLRGEEKGGGRRPSPEKPGATWPSGGKE